MCEMIFEVQGKTDNYVQLEKDGKGIKFLGKYVKINYSMKKWYSNNKNIIIKGYIIINISFTLGGRMLVEYEIQLEALQIESVNDISRAICKVRISWIKDISNINMFHCARIVHDNINKI